MAYHGGDLPAKRAERGSRLTVIGGGLQSRTGFRFAIARKFGTAIGRAIPSSNRTLRVGSAELDDNILRIEAKHLFLRYFSARGAGKPPRLTMVDCTGRERSFSTTPQAISNSPALLCG